MAVTLVPASRHFETQSFFLKQSVAKASINSDPLTLPVPVNGAKSDRLLVTLTAKAQTFNISGFLKQRHPVFPGISPDSSVVRTTDCRFVRLD